MIMVPPTWGKGAPKPPSYRSIDVVHAIGCQVVKSRKYFDILLFNVQHFEQIRVLIMFVEEDGVCTYDIIQRKWVWLAT